MCINVYLFQHVKGHLLRKPLDIDCFGHMIIIQDIKHNHHLKFANRRKKIEFCFIFQTISDYLKAACFEQRCLILNAQTAKTAQLLDHFHDFLNPIKRSRLHSVRGFKLYF